MASKKRLLKDLRVYAILDDGLLARGPRLLEKFISLIDSPVDAIQLRFSDFSRPELYALAVRMNGMARARGIPLIINDRPEVALSLGASGVHLGKGDMPVGKARTLLGAGAIIGRTIREGDRIDAEELAPADYFSIGPVFRTPLKPGLSPVSGHALKKLAEEATKPLVAIGGINSGNVSRIISRGVRAVAFARYGITVKDTVRKITELREAIGDR